MLIQPDKLRKLLILVFSALFLFLAIQIRFDMLFMHVIDNGASLVIQNLIPHGVQNWINFGGLFAHYWILVPAMVLVSSLLYFMNYKNCYVVVYYHTSAVNAASVDNIIYSANPLVIRSQAWASHT